MVDHRQFDWKDKDWKGIDLKEMVIYELHVGTFTPEGTFSSAIKRLGDLKDLGINALEIMPIAQFPGDRNWGYDGVYPYAVQNSYGGPDKLKELVNACHRNGMAVVLDVVYNHIGPEGNYLREISTVIGAEGLSDRDKIYLESSDKFEQEFISQGEHERRTVEETLGIGWKIFSGIPVEDLKLIRQEFIDKYLPKVQDRDLTD